MSPLIFAKRLRRERPGREVRTHRCGVRQSANGAQPIGCQLFQPVFLGLLLLVAFWLSAVFKSVRNLLLVFPRIPTGSNAVTVPGCMRANPVA